MRVLGIESSCDECSAAVVVDGREVRSHVVATQVDVHRPYYGVVPELASRTHTERIVPVVERAVSGAEMTFGDVDAVAVTNRPGLVGSLLVGLSYAKALSYGLGVPFVAVNHVEAHLYAPQLEGAVPYPHLGVIISGGHTLIGVVEDVFRMEVVGTTIDDACGEAFDKVAKHYDFGFPGGKAIDDLARNGEADAFSFPDPSLHKGDHRYDVSYSGLKTAVVNQLDRFLRDGYEPTRENIAASFERVAIDIILRRIDRAVADTGMRRVVVGGGVAANTYLRRELVRKKYEAFIPSLRLCTDNGAMIAGLGYHYVRHSRVSQLDENAFSRVPEFRRRYP